MHTYSTLRASLLVSLVPRGSLRVKCCMFLCRRTTFFFLFRFSFLISGRCSSTRRYTSVYLLWREYVTRRINNTIISRWPYAIRIGSASRNINCHGNIIAYKYTLFIYLRACTRMKIKIHLYNTRKTSDLVNCWRPIALNNTFCTLYIVRIHYALISVYVLHYVRDDRTALDNCDYAHSRFLMMIILLLCVGFPRDFNAVTSWDVLHSIIPLHITRDRHIRRIVD